MFGRADERYIIGKLQCGRAEYMRVSVYAYTEKEIGAACVGLGNRLDDLLERLMPEQARELARLLIEAADVADEKKPRPNALQDWLSNRKE